MNKFAEHIKKHVSKKATVGYNAKPESLEEEMAIDLAEEIETAANLALEKAGLFWGGYSGEEERKERVEVIKKAIKPLITNRLKKSIEGPVYDLVIEHLTDTNAHTVVSAIEEIMKDKQASKCAKVNKKANFLNDFKANVLEINTKQLEQIRDTAKDMGDEIWAKINGKIEKIIAYGYDNGKLKIVYREPYYGEEEIKEMYDNADEIAYIDFETLELQKESSKSANLTKKAFTYKDEKAALAKFLNIKEEDLIKNEENFHFGIPEFTTKSGEQYSVSASESAIKDAVAENMENLFDELGFEEFKEKVLPHVGGFENTFSVSESHFYDEVYRELEEDGIEEPTDEQIEKRQQEIIDNYGSAEEFFIEFGDEYVKQMIDHGDASFDFKKMAEDVIDQYGAGHELSSYDNSTEEVEYNGKTYYIFRQARRNNKMNKKANKEKILAIDIDDQEFLQGLARKYPLATVREIQRALFNLKKTNITETIMSEVADYFKNNGFEVKEKGIGFEIKANKNVKKATNKLVSIIKQAINNYTRPPEGEDAIEFDIYYDNGRAQWDFDDCIKRYGDEFVYVDWGNYNEDDVIADNIKITTKGYSQGDYAKVYIPKELKDNKGIQQTIDHLFWDSPVYGIIKINDEEIYVDELLSDVYEWNKEEILSKIKNDVSQKTYEYLKNNLPEHLDYKG